MLEKFAFCRRLGATLLALAAAAASSTSLAAVLDVGSGPDRSFVVFEANELAEPQIYRVSYTYDAGDPLDGFDLLVIALGAPQDLGGGRARLGDSSFAIEVVNFGSGAAPSYFVDAVFAGATEIRSTAFPDVGPFWAQWVSGGVIGEFPLGTPAELPDGAWAFGAGVSTPWRLAEPGSWDGYVFNDGVDPPATAPVPEPAGIAFAFAAAALALGSLRRRLR